MELEERLRKIEDFVADTLMHRRAVSIQMGSMEKAIEQNSVALAGVHEELRSLNLDNQAVKADVSAVMEWTRKNNTLLTSIGEVLTGLENARKLGDTAVRYGKPFAYLAAIVGAVFASVWASIKLTSAWISSHAAGWMR